MSRRNDYDYFDLDNFDDGYDSRDYKRRQPTRRQGSYNRRPVYNTGRKRRNRRRTRNRIIIVTSGILIFLLIFLLLFSLLKSCSAQKEQALAGIPTDTKPSASSSSNKNEAVAKDDLSPLYFKTPKIEDNKKDGEMIYSVYRWNKQAYELFGSNEQKESNYAETINGFADQLKGITVYNMVIPNHTEMGLPQRLKDSSAPSSSQADNIKSIYSKLSDKVTAINAYNYLANHNSEYIYFGSDHHWTGLGAYYAYTAFAESTKQNVLSLDDCTMNSIEGFTGTFTQTIDGLDVDTVQYWDFPYSVTMDITDSYGNVSNYTSPYYKSAVGGQYTYGAFIVGDNPLTVLKSESENAEEGKKIAVVKESYGNAFVPYLTNNYQEVHVIDFRHYSGNLPTYCEENGIDEVLFINGVMSANTQIQLDSMSSLF